jgi:hypothetical protein
LRDKILIDTVITVIVKSVALIGYGSRRARSVHPTNENPRIPKIRRYRPGAKVLKLDHPPNYGLRPFSINRGNPAVDAVIKVTAARSHHEGIVGVIKGIMSDDSKEEFRPGRKTSQIHIVFVLPIRP